MARTYGGRRVAPPSAGERERAGRIRQRRPPDHSPSTRLSTAPAGVHRLGGRTAAPRLAETWPGPAGLAGLWDQLVKALVDLARDGLAHGDLSAYNLLVHDGRLVMIDLPQVVDVITW